MATSLHWRKTVGALFPQLRCFLAIWFAESKWCVVEKMFHLFTCFFFKKKKQRENRISHGWMTSRISRILEFHYLVVSSESDVHIKRNGPWSYFIIRINNNLVTGTMEVRGKGRSTPFHDVCDCGQMRTLNSVHSWVQEAGTRPYRTA